MTSPVKFVQAAEQAKTAPHAEILYFYYQFRLSLQAARTWNVPERQIFSNWQSLYEPIRWKLPHKAVKARIIRIDIIANAECQCTNIAM